MTDFIANHHALILYAVISLFSLLGLFLKHVEPKSLALHAFLETCRSVGLDPEKFLESLKKLALALLKVAPLAVPVAMVAAVATAPACAVAKPACQVVDLANEMCHEFVLADGSHVRVSHEDAADPERLSQALKLPSPRACR